MGSRSTQLLLSSRATTGAPIVTRVARGLAVAAVLAPAAAGAQIGAIAAVGAAGGAFSGTGTFEQAPLFIESGILFPRGRWALGAQASGRTLTLEEGGISAKLTQNVYSLGAVYGITDRITVGASVPYADVDFNVPGFGHLAVNGMADASLYGKFQAYGDQSTAGKGAFFASVGIPTGEKDFRGEGFTVSPGFALTRRVQKVSLHAQVAATFYTSDKDSEDTDLNYGAAGVFSLAPSVALSGELLGFSSGDTRTLDLGAGVRFRVGSSVFLSGGYRYNLSVKDIDPKRFDGFLFGLNLVL